MHSGVGGELRSQGGTTQKKGSYLLSILYILDPQSWLKVELGIARSAFPPSALSKSPPGQAVEPVFWGWTAPPSPHVGLFIWGRWRIWLLRFKIHSGGNAAQRSWEMRGVGAESILGRACAWAKTHLLCLHLFTSPSKFCFWNVVTSVLSGRCHPEELARRSQTLSQLEHHNTSAFRYWRVKIFQ